MTKIFFDQAIKKLERLFKPLDKDQADVYFEMFKSVDEATFEKAVGLIARTHENKFFPLPKQFWDAVNDVRDDRRRSTPEGSPEDYANLNYCCKCQNSGMFIEEIPPYGNSVARYCECTRGKSLRFAHTKNKDLKNQGKFAVDKPIEKELREWNPLGFWEDTQEEHDRWMTMKRLQIAEMDIRRQREKPKPVPKYAILESLNEREWKREVKQILGKLDKPKQEEKQDDGIDF